MARKANLRRKVERRIERVKSKLAKRAFRKKKAEADTFEGYEGNEAVVSPVTGILLDYGVYDDNDIIETTKETE